MFAALKFLQFYAAPNVCIYFTAKLPQLDRRVASLGMLLHPGLGCARHYLWQMDVSIARSIISISSLLARAELSGAVWSGLARLRQGGGREGVFCGRWLAGRQTPRTPANSPNPSILLSQAGFVLFLTLRPLPDSQFPFAPSRLDGALNINLNLG